MFNHPFFIWLFVIVFCVLAILFYGLLRWNTRLKTALDIQLALHNASDLNTVKLEALSKKTINLNISAFVLITIVIFVSAIFFYKYYETHESITTSVTETILLMATLFGGFFLGSLWRRYESTHFLGQLIGQASKREWIERKISLSEDRLENQQLAITTLTQNQLQDWHDPSEVFKELAMISAQTLNVERVGVWLLNADRTELNCTGLYLKSQHEYIEAEPLIRQALPQYFNALENNRLLVANNVMQHEATVELMLDYMPKYNIGATLEGGIWLNNQFIGVICHEHVGGVREWTLDEQSFVGSITALANLTIETHRRRQAELALMLHSEQLEHTIQARTELLQESDKRLSYVVQHAPIAILMIDRNGNIVDLNAEAAASSGYSREAMLGKHFIRLIVAKESRSQAILIAASALKGENIRHVELLLQNAKGEKFEYECSVGMTAKSATDGSGLMVAIAQNISQQKALQNSLIKAREAAEAADRIKSMFVASMSHELRTPLNSIIGFIGVVLQGISGELNPIQKGQLDRAYQSSKHLLLLISDVLDVSKIEAGFLQLNNEKFELKPLLIEAEHAVQHLLAGKELTLSIHCAAKLHVEMDRKRLYQVVLNVMSNAIKYTEKGEVKVSAELTDKQLKISCEDTGIGIIEADFAKLFQPFVRVESPLKIKTPGTGLGLYLTHKILTQLFGGSITVRSELGQGSTFIIIIPTNKSARPAQKLVSGVEPKLKDTVL